MVFISLLLTSFLVLRVVLTSARPTTGELAQRTSCNLPPSRYYTCVNDVVTIQSRYGSFQGALTSEGAIRFSIKYATAQRFQPPVLNSFHDAFQSSTILPPVCPQAGVDPSNYSEDCLYLVAYAPPSLTPAEWVGGAPVMVWIHGGSFKDGGASDPAIDGSKLAQATGSIVVVVQYRLGILGYLPPTSQSSNMNLGVRDVIAALQFIKDSVGCMGGDSGRITLAGHSSGGTMVRNLLATPSASNLFEGAILESDPMNYGFLGLSTFNNYQAAYYTDFISCGSCLTTPVETLISAQTYFLGNATTIDPAGGTGEPLRPVLDGTLITTSLTTTFPPVYKHNLLLTTLKDDAGQATYASVPPLPSSYWDYMLSLLYFPSRVSPINQNYNYAQSSTDDIRPWLTELGTDGAWRCPNYALAREWASRGGSVWVGEFQLGSTYPLNTQLSFCNLDEQVCHQDDIQIVFGTVLNPTPVQTALIAEVQSRWGAFLKYQNPNTSGYQNWVQVPPNGVVPVHNLGGTGPIDLGGCDPAIWGNAIPFDYQIFNQ